MSEPIHSHLLRTSAQAHVHTIARVPENVVLLPAFMLAFETRSTRQASGRRTIIVYFGGHRLHVIPIAVDTRSSCLTVCLTPLDDLYRDDDDTRCRIANKSLPFGDYLASLSLYRSIMRFTRVHRSPSAITVYDYRIVEPH